MKFTGLGFFRVLNSSAIKVGINLGRFRQNINVCKNPINDRDTIGN